MFRRTAYLLTTLLLLPLAAFAQTKRPLDHDAYEIWKAIEDEALSDDGRWILYSLVLEGGDSELRVHGLRTDATFSIPRAKSARFTRDSRFVVALVAPEQALVKQAKRDKKDSDQMPKDSLIVLDLSSGDAFKAARVKSFSVPEEQGRWLAYLLEAELEQGVQFGEQEQEGQSPQEGPEEPERRAKKDKEDGTTLVLRDLTNGGEIRYQYVSAYAFASNGEYLAFAASSKDGAADGVFVIGTAGGDATGVLTGSGNYKKLVFAEDGTQLAFLSDRDDYDAEQPGFTLYRWVAGSAEATEVAAEGSPGLPSGWWVSENGDLEFSKNGARLFFGTAPRPEPEVEDSTLEEDRVDVEIWHWQDPLLQPMQQLQADGERRRAYPAVTRLADGRIVQLATEDVPEVDLVLEGTGDFVLGTSGLRYRQLISWDSPSYQDVHLIDVNTGERRKIREQLQDSARVSPGGKYVYWWDNVELAWVAYDVADGGVVNMTAGVPHPTHNEDHDWPYRPDAYGSGGWTEGDEEFLVYDRYDVWAVDPEGEHAPRNVTDGAGRREGLRFRHVRLDREARSVGVRDPLLLSAFDLQSKAAGFYRDRVRGAEAPQKLVFLDRRFSDPTKAKDADVIVFTRESVADFPDLWVSDSDFGEMRKVSDANPQQSEYLWATAELIEWHSVDGRALNGLLYKPEDFDPTRKHPLMVTFYEKDSDNLHAHHPPVPHRSVVRPTFYASRGYVVFVPDIFYEVGYPGESAMDCVVPGVLSLIEQGFVDERAIGVQGHSWGGYQITYMVTKTDLFAAAAGGAPVSNMISAYGGIRWGSGMSRMFQYEKTQSRIGATLWEAPVRYIENSPIFWADKVKTPLMMMHNDHDHAVPWYQGIEMFVALRRLGKPAWLINYVGELHWPQDFHERRDWNIRMQQFFDHYLKGTAAPVWLAEGIPALQQGKTLGLEVAIQDPLPDGGS